MKRFEFTVTRDRLTIHREAEQQLTASQKTAILLTVIICITFLKFVALVAHA